MFVAAIDAARDALFDATDTADAADAADAADGAGAVAVAVARADAGRLVATSGSVEEDDLPRYVARLRVPGLSAGSL